MLNEANVIEIAKACTVTFVKARNSLVVRCREKRVSWEKTENAETLFFKDFANRFWSKSKSCLCFNKVVHCRPSIKWNS